MQSSLLSFFTRTPKRNENGENSSGASTAAESVSSSNGNSVKKEKKVEKVTNAIESPGTPTGRGASKKRRPSEPLNNEKRRKKVRVIESESSGMAFIAG